MEDHDPNLGKHLEQPDDVRAVSAFAVDTNFCHESGVALDVIPKFHNFHGDIEACFEMPPTIHLGKGPDANRTPVQRIVFMESTSVNAKVGGWKQPCTHRGDLVCVLEVVEGGFVGGED